VLLFRALIPLLLLIVPGAAGATVVGTILSGPTSDDPLAVYWNPAATTLAHGHRAMLFSGTTMIDLAYQRYSANSLDGAPYPRADMFIAKPEIAFGFVTDALHDRLRLGVGLATPVLDGARWSPTYEGRPASTRLYAVEAHQAHIFIRPALAYRLHRMVSVGVGLDIIGIWLRSDTMVDLGARLNQMACRIGRAGCQVGAPFSREDPALEARMRINDVGWDVGVAGGVLLEPWPWLRLGASVASGAGEVDVPIDVQIELPPDATRFAGSAVPGVKLPDLRSRAVARTYSPMMVTAGVMVLPTPRLELAADLHWIQKSKMSVMLVEIRQTNSELIADQVLVKVVQDAFTVGLRGSYRLRSWLTLALRGEYISNTMPDRFTTPVSLDFDKLHLQAGLAWHVTPWLTAIAEYGHTVLFARTINESAFSPNPDPRTAVEEGLDKPSPVGRYTGYAVALTGALVVAF